MKLAFVFPGQGSQYVGMGKDFIKHYEEAQNLITQAEKVINHDLQKYLFYEEDNKSTNKEFSQISVILIEIIIYQITKKRLKNLEIDIDLYAGHSLGEYAALFASKILNFKEVLELVTERTKIMNKDTLSIETGMTAIGGSPIETTQSFIENLQIDGIFPSNINSYKQIVYSGEISNLEKLENSIVEFSKAIRLNVPKGYHSIFMNDAKEQYQKFIKNYKFEKNKVEQNLIGNIDGNFYKNFDEVVIALSNQLVSPVNWITVVEKLIEQDVTHIIEIGPGKILTRLNKNILKKNGIDHIKLLKIENIRDLENVILELST